MSPKSEDSSSQHPHPHPPKRSDDSDNTDAGRQDVGGLIRSMIRSAIRTMIRDMWMSAVMRVTGILIWTCRKALIMRRIAYRMLMARRIQMWLPKMLIAPVIDVPLHSLHLEISQLICNSMELDVLTIHLFVFGIDFPQ
jgi:hypothetical protein